MDLTMTSLCYYCKKQHRKECDKERNIMPADSDYSYQHCSHQWVAKCTEFESKYELIRHGDWIEDFDCGGVVLSCSLCDEHYWIEREEDLEFCKPNYCPNCGARMDGDNQ